MWKYHTGLEQAAVEDTVCLILFSFLKPIFVIPKK